MSRIISEVLNQILYEQDRQFTPADLAVAAHCSESHISRVRADESELSMTRVQQLALFLARHGRLELARCFITPDHEIVPRGTAAANGCLDDDVATLVEAVGRAICSFRDGNTTDLDAALTDIGRAYDAMKAERDRL